MNKYYTIITDIGKQKISNAILVNGKLNINKMFIGDGNGSNYEPSESQTSLVNKVYEADVISVSIDTNNDSYVVVQAIIPPDVGNFFIRELGLVDADGDLIALAKFPETYKPIMDSGSVKEVVIKMIIKVANTDVINIIINNELIEGTITADNFSMYGLTVVNKTTGVTTLEITENGECYANFAGVKINGNSINTLISDSVDESKDYADQKYSELEQTLEGFEFTVKDLQTAIVSITDDGIKVAIQEADEDLGYSLINSEGITVYDSDDNKLAWFGDNDSAYIKKLQADDILCDKVVKKLGTDFPRNWQVSPEASGDGTGIDSNNVSNSFNDVMNYIKKEYGDHLDGIDITINLSEGTYTENLTIAGFSGYGRMVINVNPNAILYSDFFIYNNTIPITVDGQGTSAFDTGAIIYSPTNAFRVRNSHVLIQGFRCRPQTNLYDGTVADRAFVVCEEGAFVTARWNDIVGYYQVIYARTNIWNGSAKLYENRGWVNRILNCDFGNITIGGKYPKISANDSGVMNNISYLSGAIQTNSRWLPVEENSSTPDTPIPPTPDVPVQTKVLKTFTQSFTASKIYTTVEGSGSATSTKTDKTGQGYHGSYKKHRGHAIIPNSLANTLSSAESWTIKVKLHRWSTRHGQSGAVPVPKFVTTINTTNTYNCNKAFALGDTATVYVGDTLNTKIGNGTIKDLQFYSANSSDYSFYDKVVFEVTYKKYV